MLLVYVIWEISEGRIVGTVLELFNSVVPRIVTLRVKGGVPRPRYVGTCLPTWRPKLPDYSLIPYRIPHDVTSNTFPHSTRSHLKLVRQ